MATFSDFNSYPIFSGVTKEKQVSAGINNTDVIAPEFKLYIEGVQVPFEVMSISQSYNGLPYASIQIPPESGLLDITRGYEPKVHIFYKDDHYGGFRLLFWGHIKSSSYSRSRIQGNTSISFQCQHKNALLNQLTLDYSGWVTQGAESVTNAGNTNSAKPNFMNSVSMVIDALSGINGVAVGDEVLHSSNSKINSAPTDKLDPSLSRLEGRLNGLPGISVNLWNQIKKGALTSKYDNIALNSMFIPLVEEGLGYFKRMSGHPYLEERLQLDKNPYCHKEGSKEVKILIPPCFRSSMASAMQADLTVKNIANIIGFSGELTSYAQVMSSFYSYSKYDVNTLASPAEVNADHSIFIEDLNVSGVEKIAIETIIKPQIPFYYSPACNVLLPRMYVSVQVSQDEASTPTRTSALHDATPSKNASAGMNTTFNAPPSIREAIAYNAILKGVNGVKELNLGSTTGFTYHIPGKYEQGVGIRPERISIPWWLAMFMSDKDAQGQQPGKEAFPEKGTEEYNNLMILTVEWRSRYANKITQDDGTVVSFYDSGKNKLNPNDPTAGILPHQRILFSTVDYEFSEKVASSRTGSIEALFNPYIIPGYPMDVIDDSPNHPSFHGYCTSVVHTITSRSVTTNVSMVAVSTYAELSNFYTPSLTPFLESALGIVTADIDDALYAASTERFDASPFTNPASTIIQNPKAKAIADTFYKQVLGVGAVAPDDLIHFSSGRAYPMSRYGATLVPKIISGGQSLPDIKPHPKVARETDDYYTSVGNLRMVRRPIESKDSISAKFSYNFIDLDPRLYNTSFVNYVNPLLASDLLLEPGASLFLDYMETSDFIKVPKG